MWRGFLVSVAALVLSACVSAQNNPPVDIPLEQWLLGPEHHDFEWKVQVVGPWLTFQQRYVTEVRSIFSVRKLIRSGVSLADLDFVVKVAGEDGRWFPGHCYSRFVPPPDIAKAKEIRSYAHFYVRPGKYKIAVIGYDSRNHRGNLWKGELQVPPLPGDPLPEMSRNLPPVEFPQQVALGAGETGGRHATVAGIDWTAGPSTLFLPVSNLRPIQLDLVVNLSLSDAWNTRYAQAPDWVYQTNAGLLLQMSKVVSQLDLKNGCVRVSAVDLLRQTVFADRIPAPDLDWPKLTRSVASLQRNKIDVRVLERQKLTPALFANFLEQVVTGTASCGQPGQAPLHVLVVISDAFMFPLKTEMTTVRPELFSESRCYFLQVDPVRGGTWDQIGRVLRPLHPTRWEFSNATQFRKVLAQLIAGIESASRESKPSPPPP